MKKLLFLVMCLMSTGTFAQKTTDGGITPAMLQQIQQSAQQSPAQRALRNAMVGLSIDELAKNYTGAAKPLDSDFSVETPKQSITDQKSRGRCWLFSSLNVLRADFAASRKNAFKVELSQDYLFFYDQLEKANLFLQGVWDTAREPMESERVRFFFKAPISDGGTFCGLVDLAPKYGVVPASVVPETYSAENTSRMRALVSSKLREYGLELRKMVAEKQKKETIQAQKTQMLSEVYRLLCLTLGEPVKEFQYTLKSSDGESMEETTFTPQTFYRLIMGDKKLEDSFIMVMNDPRREYHKTYEVEWDRHSYDGTNWCYLNLPMEDIEQLAIAQLKGGRKLYSSYDVGKFLDRKRGYADLANFDYATLFDTTFPMTKAERISTFDSGSTHAMTLTAVDLDAAGKPLKWKVENSWGSSFGTDGHLIMTAEWFREYMFRLVVDKEFVPQQLLEEAKQKPVMVMPEDPLFQFDE